MERPPPKDKGGAYNAADSNTSTDTDNNVGSNSNSRLISVQKERREIEGRRM
jgi:hypothetical protein